MAPFTLLNLPSVVALPKYLTSNSTLVFGTSNFHFCGTVAATPIIGSDKSRQQLSVIFSKEVTGVVIYLIQRVVEGLSVVKKQFAYACVILALLYSF